LKFNRLITFGDSSTYGHGLPDCFIPPYNAGDYPSELGWVNILADKLNIDKIINLARPGASNRFILHRIINFNDFKKDDLVIIQFAHLTRDFYFKSDSKIEFVGSWNLDPDLDLDVNWKYFLGREELEYTFRSYEYILSCINFMKLKESTFHCMSVEPIDNFTKFIDNTNVEDTIVGLGSYKFTSALIKNTFEDIKKYFTLKDCHQETNHFLNINKDYALDGTHWGEKTHNFCAEKIQYYLEKND